MKSSQPPRIRFIVFLALVVTPLTACSHALHRQPVGGETPIPLRGLATQVEFRVSPRTLASEIAARRDRVAEFRFLRQYAKEHGMRIYLAGGSAAGFAHYVKQDLEREWLKSHRLPDKYFDSRFHYDYYDIYRSTQDIDIVIDVPDADDAEHERQAEALEKALISAFPYTQGSKSSWEVRFLKVGRGVRGNPSYKDPILGFDFLSQNSDSHSTGLIDLATDVPSTVVRDVKHFESRDPQFLSDVVDGELHFYEEPAHSQTLRAASGLNPEILSAIRALGKAFQYGLTLRPEDEEKIRRIIDRFDPRSARYKDSYIRKQIENNALKLFWHAQDVEEAWNTLESLGLRKKLIEYAGDTNRNAMGIWLDREPLRSRPVGSGKGKTAKELGISIVAHETNQFLAYENITRSTRGRPNVFVSRPGHTNESAAHGKGFYTRRGREGARQTGLTIRFEIDPEAREGSDFRIASTDFVIVLNRNAIRVIDETVELDPLTFFELIVTQRAIASDLGLFEKMKRKVLSRTATLDAEKAREVADYVGRFVGSQRIYPQFFESWFESPLSLRFPEMVAKALKAQHTADLAITALSKPGWEMHPEIASQIIDGDVVNESTRKSLIRNLISYVLPNDEWTKQRGVVDRLLRDPKNHEDIIRYLFSKEKWALLYIQQISELLEGGQHDEALAQAIVRNGLWKEHPEWIRTLVKRGHGLAAIARGVLPDPASQSYPDWVDAVLDGTGDNDVTRICVEAFLHLPHWAHHPQWIEKLVAQKKQLYEIAFRVLTRPEWSHRYDLLEQVIRHIQDPFVDDIVRVHLQYPSWNAPKSILDAIFDRISDNITRRRVEIFFSTLETKQLLTPELALEFIARAKDKLQIAEQLLQVMLTNERWLKNPNTIAQILKLVPESAILFLNRSRKDLRWLEHSFLYEIALSDPRNDGMFEGSILTLSQSSEHPEWLATIIARNQISSNYIEDILRLEHWHDHPVLREWCDGKTPTPRLIRNAIRAGRVLPSRKIDSFGCSGFLRKFF